MLGCLRRIFFTINEVVPSTPPFPSHLPCPPPLMQLLNFFPCPHPPLPWGCPLFQLGVRLRELKASLSGPCEHGHAVKRILVHCKVKNNSLICQGLRGSEPWRARVYNVSLWRSPAGDQGLSTIGGGQAPLKLTVFCPAEYVPGWPSSSRLRPRRSTVSSRCRTRSRRLTSPSVWRECCTVPPRLRHRHAPCSARMLSWANLTRNN